MSTIKPTPASKFARQDPSLCFAPIFRGLARNTSNRKINWMKVVYEQGSTTIEFEGPVLGPEDLRVLQGLIALSGMSGRPLEVNNAVSVDEKLLLKGLKLKDMPAGAKSLVIQFSFARLAAEIGYQQPEGQKVAKVIRDSIERLWKLTIIVRQGDKSFPFSLLSYLGSDIGKKNEGCVALNPSITAVILGLRPHYVRIDMDEVRALHSGPARILHQKLSALVDQGASRTLKIETLCGYVWPEPATKNTMRKRRHIVRKALEELTETGGWMAQARAGKPDTVIVSRKEYQRTYKSNPKALPARQLDAVTA